MSDEARVDVVPKYRGGALSSFDNGVVLDLRVKMAAEFLKGSYFGGGGLHHDVNLDGGPSLQEMHARRALDLAGALLDEAAARGLLWALPADGEVDEATRAHITFNARAQVAQQVAAQRAIEEVSGGVVAARGGLPPGMRQ